jgi:hypothetical protein
MLKKPARPSDPRELARAIVERRIPLLESCAGFVHGEIELAPDSTRALQEWNDLVRASLAAEDREVTKQEETRIAEILAPADLEEAEIYRRDAWAQAGFLVGLELGRRLGGAR